MTNTIDFRIGNNKRASFRANHNVEDMLTLLEITFACNKSKAVAIAITEAYQVHFEPLLSYALDNVQLNDDGSIDNEAAVTDTLVTDYGCNAETARQAVHKAARKLRYKR